MPECATTLDALQIGEVSLVRGLLRSGEARQIRLAAGVSPAEVAKAAGVDPATIWRWEHGHRAPRTDAALRLAPVYRAAAEAVAALAGGRA
ncbi:MAG: helix-turn-helix transcriptional regulator [Acidimicrobiales bacterium]